MLLEDSYYYKQRYCFIIITDEIRLIRSGDEEVKLRRLQTQGKEFDLQNFHRYDEVSVWSDSNLLTSCCKQRFIERIDRF